MVSVWIIVKNYPVSFIVSLFIRVDTNRSGDIATNELQAALKNGKSSMFGGGASIVGWSSFFQNTFSALISDFATFS